MPFVFVVPKPQPVLNRGIYPAVLVSIEPRESGGRSYLVWAFEIASRGGSIVVKTSSSTSFGVKSKARTWVEALLGRALQPGESVSTDDLLGARCLLVLGQRQRDDGSVFNTIEQVLPATDEEVVEPF